MTIKDLSQLYNIRKRLEERRETLATLDARATKVTASVGGMHHGSGISDKTGIGAEMADLRREIEDLAAQEERELLRLCRYITGVQDAYIQRLLRLRFLEGLTWRQVAFKAGGGNTEDGVRKAVFRFVNGNFERK